MIVNLAKDLRIVCTDRMNFTLETRKTVVSNVNGVETKQWKPVGYHGTFDMACVSAFNNYLALLPPDRVVSLKEIVESVKVARKAIQAASDCVISARDAADDEIEFVPDGMPESFMEA